MYRRQFLKIAGILVGSGGLSEVMASTASNGHSTTGVVELVKFELKPAVDSADFIQVAQQTQGFLSQQNGFIQRRLLRQQQQWMDVVDWSDLGAAEQAAKAFYECSECQPFMQMIDESSLQLWHLEPQKW